jgi:hypothetical protein
VCAGTTRVCKRLRLPVRDPLPRLRGGHPRFGFRRRRRCSEFSARPPVQVSADVVVSRPLL